MSAFSLSFERAVEAIKAKYAQKGQQIRDEELAASLSISKEQFDEYAANESLVSSDVAKKLLDTHHIQVVSLTHSITQIPGEPPPPPPDDES